MESQPPFFLWESQRPQLFERIAEDVRKNTEYPHYPVTLAGGTMKVIIVDDSLVTRTIIQRSLASMGYEALHAVNGQVALELLEKQAPEVGLILLDWNMPVLNGYETVKCIKKIDAYRHICIVMISTESEDDKIDQALAAGAHGYLTKPFTDEEFAETIRSTLDRFKSGKTSPKR
jgi:two-component system, chemotaxis family, chemotaxis protein CheY